jgi:hypothetical protein
MIRFGYNCNPFEPEFGSITETHFETRDTGHLLDDLVLILRRGLKQRSALLPSRVIAN